MQTLNLDLGDRSYPIYIGQGLLQQAPLLTEHIQGKSCVTVTNETIAPLYLAAITTALKPYRHSSVVLPDIRQND